MAIKTSSYNSNKVVKKDINLKHFLIWLRDHGINYRTMDYEGRGWILDGEIISDDEIIKKYGEDD